MPRFKIKGTLERTAVADLWKHTLSGIPSTYGKLMCLAGLRDPHSGRYRHYGLSAAFGREESSLALQQCHEQVFREWLNLTLPEKSADLGEYLSGLDEHPGLIAIHWLRGGYYDNLLPDRATRAQRVQFRQELQILLEIIRNGASGGVGAPGSSLHV